MNDSIDYWARLHDAMLEVAEKHGGVENMSPVDRICLSVCELCLRQATLKRLGVPNVETHDTDDQDFQ